MDIQPKDLDRSFQYLQIPSSCSIKYSPRFHPEISKDPAATTSKNKHYRVRFFDIKFVISN